MISKSVSLRLTVVLVFAAFVVTAVLYWTGAVSTANALPTGVVGITSVTKSVAEVPGLSNGDADADPGEASGPPNISVADVNVNTITLARSMTIAASRTLTVNVLAALGSNVISGAGTLAVGINGTVTRTAGGQVETTLQKSFAVVGPFTYHVGMPGAYSPVFVNVTAGSVGSSLSVKANTGTEK